MPPEKRPSHHVPGGGFRNPWGGDSSVRGTAAIWRWQWQRLRDGRPDLGPLDVPRAEPAFDAPRAAPDELTVTWIGQASWLIQIGGLNLLTDPVFSRRASPVSWVGPARLSPPGITLEALPPIDGVLLSHDHYDHLDDASVRRLYARYGDDPTWFAPLGFARWLARRGITRVAELDWWQRAEMPLPAGGTLEVTATPAQHWCRRGPRSNDRLWCSFALRAFPGGVLPTGVLPSGAVPGAAPSAGHGGSPAASPAASLYFGGDSGYCPAFREIGERVGPFDVSLLPIGAYEPRWFMKPAHMNPEEAVQAWTDLGAAGALAGMHWGTFVLTDEPVLEPPRRAREAWRERGLPASALWLPAIGETRRRGRTQEGSLTRTVPTTRP